MSNFDAGARDKGVEDRVLLGKFAKLVNGARDVRDAGGVSSLFPGSDFTGVLEKCSKLDRTSVCCNIKSMLLSSLFHHRISYQLIVSRSSREKFFPSHFILSRLLLSSIDNRVLLVERVDYLPRLSIFSTNLMTHFPSL